MGDFGRSDDASPFPPADTGAQAPTEVLPSQVPTKDLLGRDTVLGAEDGASPTARSAPGGLSRFEVLGELGRGGMGEVFLVRDRDISRTVAVKRLAPGASARAAARFAEEVRTLGKLEHPNIAPVYDVGVDPEGRSYFLMQHVRGETLADIIARLRDNDPETLARFPLESRAQLILSVLRALSHAHARGLVHCDLKPANLMVGETGEVSVLDWGIAQWTEQAPEHPVRDGAPGERGEQFSSAGRVVGTPRYMSPEQARGDGSPLDGRSDLYSLGVVFHELLYLRHYLGPRKGLKEVLAGVEREVVYRGPAERLHDPTLPPVPSEFEWFLKRALEKAPSERFQSAGQMMEGLLCTLRGDFPVECHVTLIKRFLRRFNGWLDRSPLLVPLGLAAGAGMVAACCIYTLLHALR